MFRAGRHPSPHYEEKREKGGGKKDHRRRMYQEQKRPQQVESPDGEPFEDAERAFLSLSASSLKAVQPGFGSPVSVKRPKEVR